ncbi:MAG TPA: tetratricopeptide repeat protein [Burkholderiales bacterium]|nr:tetratricopeptide repeat protein [Burkholderiales bacterium]
MQSIEHWLHFYAGRALLMFNLQDAAVERLHLALKCNPRFDRAASSLGFIYASMRQYPVAARYFEQALQINPQAAGLWFNLGFIHEEQKHFAQAIEAFRKAVALNPKIDRAWYGMGLAHAALGEHEKAAEAVSGSGHVAADEPLPLVPAGNGASPPEPPRQSRRNRRASGKI